ncbi:MAG: hypothetical protein ACKVS8_12840 [Phycisphaerales bacterium]
MATAACLAACGLGLAACGGGDASATRATRDPQSRTLAPPAGTPSARPAAMVDSEPVEWSALTPLLAEAAGGAVLQEIVLDRRLERELALRSQRVGDAEIAAERDRVRAALAAGPAAVGLQALDADQAQTATDAVRRARGLGDLRFEALVRRNASLRLLVKDEVRIDEANVQLAHAIRHGPKLRLRLITTNTQAEAQAARAQLATEEPDLAGRFSRLAQRVSTDPTGRGGGVLGLVSPADPSYPMVIRQAAEGVLQAGASGAAGSGPGLTPVLALERGYGIVLVEERTAGSGVSLDAARPDLEREALLRAQREAMDRLAVSLISRGGVVVLDRTLDWSWRGTITGR